MAGTSKAIGVQDLEERSFNAWPARRTVFSGGWILRLCDGFTKRANSVSALTPTGAFHDVLKAAESFYSRHSQPTIFRLTPLAGNEADRLLERAGYTVLDPCVVMSMPAMAMSSREEVGGDVAIRQLPDLEWSSGIAEVNSIAETWRETHDHMIASIALPVGFATAYSRRSPVGYGMAVIDRGMIGLFNIAVCDTARGQGIGKKLSAALLRWGRTQDATCAYLHVLESNSIARSLYKKLGFAEIYRYHYRKEPVVAR